MCKLKNAQVSLESVIVFISLAVLSVACVNVFSNLNVNELKRINVYKDTRLAAVNNYGASLAGKIVWTSIGPRPLSDPTTFLDYFPNNKFTDDFSSPLLPGDDFSFVFDDPYLNTFSFYLEEFDRIFSILLAYKANQAYWFATNSTWDPNLWSWIPVGYMDTARELSFDLFANTGLVVYDYQAAIDSLKYALENDPNLTETTKKSLKRMISNLETTFSYLEKAINGLIMPRIDYITRYLGSIDWGENAPTSEHYEAVNKLSELVDFWGAIEYPFVSYEFYQTVDQIYIYFYGWPTIESISIARELTQTLLSSSEVQTQSLLKTLVKDLDENLKLAIEKWESPSRDYFIWISSTDIWVLYDISRYQI